MPVYLQFKSVIIWPVLVEPAVEVAVQPVSLSRDTNSRRRLGSILYLLVKIIEWGFVTLISRVRQ
jgi:hypothetical protein